MDETRIPSVEVEAALRDVARRIPVCTSLQFDILEMGDGWCRMRVPKPVMFDGINGVFHGGLLTTVADSVAWFAIATRGGPDTRLTTSDLHIRFLAACWTDVIAEARVIKFGRTLCPVDVALFDSDHQRVATSQVTYFRMASAPTSPNAP